MWGLNSRGVDPQRQNMKKAQKLKGLGSSGKQGKGWGRGREKEGGWGEATCFRTISAGAPMSGSVPSFPDKLGVGIAKVRAAEFLFRSSGSFRANHFCSALTPSSQMPGGHTRAWRGRLWLVAVGREPTSSALNLRGSFHLM